MSSGLDVLLRVFDIKRPLSQRESIPLLFEILLISKHQTHILVNALFVTFLSLYFDIYSDAWKSKKMHAWLKAYLTYMLCSFVVFFIIVVTSFRWQYLVLMVRLFHAWMAGRWRENKRWKRGQKKKYTFIHVQTTTQKMTSAIMA